MDISCTSRWKTSSSLLFGSALHFEFGLSNEHLLFFPRSTSNDSKMERLTFYFLGILFVYLLHIFQRSVNFKMSFWCLQIPQKIKEIFSRISTLASKKRSNKKIRALYTANWIIYSDTLTLVFWFDLFLEARVEILEKISLLFLS